MHMEELISENDLLQMMQSEDKLHDLQKEHFQNVRTMITASAAIASVDLLALQALQNVGLGSWFLASVVLLYLSAIIYSFFLTYSNNIQAKLFIERSGFAVSIKKMLEEATMLQQSPVETFLKQGDNFVQKVQKQITSTKRATKLLMVGNILFIVGLLIPVCGLIVSIL